MKLRELVRKDPKALKREVRAKNRKGGTIPDKLLNVQMSGLGDSEMRGGMLSNNEGPI